MDELLLPLGAMVLSASVGVIEMRVMLLGRSDAFRSSVAFRTQRTHHPPQLHGFQAQHRPITSVTAQLVRVQIMSVSGMSSIQLHF